jgi:hypothetical protein
METENNKTFSIKNHTQHGIGEATAKRFTDEQSEDNILRCISLYEEALQSGKVNNKSGGYLITKAGNFSPCSDSFKGECYI